jgi:alpha-1,3-rhamnosyl/mannosyltransferase
LPAVEAAACGAPVVATTNSPLPELLAGAGLFVAPGDERVLTEAMRKLFDDARFQRACAARALECASAMTWPRCASATLDALRECAR